MKRKNEQRKLDAVAWSLRRRAQKTPRAPVNEAPTFSETSTAMTKTKNILALPTTRDMMTHLSAKTSAENSIVFVTTIPKIEAGSYTISPTTTKFAKRKSESSGSFTYHPEVAAWLSARFNSSTWLLDFHSPTKRRFVTGPYVFKIFLTMRFTEMMHLKQAQTVTRDPRV
jgi:hypothetical protein